MNQLKEIHFEDEICEHLAVNGWLYAKGDAAHYDKARALFADDVLAWVKGTQPKVWETLEKNLGWKAAEVLLDRLRHQLDSRGTLEVLRNGFEMMGPKKPIKLAEFKPAMGANEEILARYKANRLRVVRQVRYSLENDNCIDLVLFLNGVPVATVELKTDFTQSIVDAIDQYRFDRIPKKKNKPAEPLLSFPGGALVHFAVSGSEVCMTTKLEGPDTTFLPFNRGDGGASGNPLNPKGHRTAYLWEEVWARESWLELVGRYIVSEPAFKQPVTKILFPRYHQLDVTRRLVAAVLEQGVGGAYLIQHSAGSGKTNSIAWTAHFLADLHDAEDKKVFDTVLVVSDRNVIDSQLQEALLAVERNKGVVAVITGNQGSKSTALADALADAKKIVVCTIQTFPFALEVVRDLTSTKGKRFAVIADEAHSSLGGKPAAKLRTVLSAKELEEVEEGAEVSLEDLLAAQMADRAEASGITFVAFTATPRNRTLELFGTRPDPSRKPAPDNKPYPFHVYSMRQAIEEKFILDVLRNYITYDMALRIAQNGKALDDKEVEESAAMKGIMGWVRLHPTNIAKKVEIVVEHFRVHVSPLLGGKAKAMVVLPNRKEAVKWKLAIEKYIKEKGYTIGTLVAFSGEVVDLESGPDPFTERSQMLNPALKGSAIRDAFKEDEYQILLVANKFQTGFDQPYLCGMYVDKHLAGIQAVQTLSRLNRAHPGKDTTYVLDFVNEPDVILAAFKTYYEVAQLESTTDPDLVYNLRAKLDATGYYDENEVNGYVKAAFDDDKKQGELAALLDPVAKRLTKSFSDAAESHRAAVAKGDEKSAAAAEEVRRHLLAFKSDMETFLRIYTFLSQIFDYGNTEIEARSIFYSGLLPLLKFGRERDPIDLSGLTLPFIRYKQQAARALVLSEGNPAPLKPEMAKGSSGGKEKEKAKLREIVERVNALFEGELTAQDKLTYVNSVILGKLLESKTLKEQASNNSKEQFASSPDLEKALLDAIMDALDAHKVMSSQALGSNEVKTGLKNILLDLSGLWEKLRSEPAKLPHRGLSPPQGNRNRPTDRALRVRRPARRWCKPRVCAPARPGPTGPPSFRPSRSQVVRSPSSPVATTCTPSRSANGVVACDRWTAPVSSPSVSSRRVGALAGRP